MIVLLLLLHGQSLTPWQLSRFVDYKAKDAILLRMLRETGVY